MMVRLLKEKKPVIDKIVSKIWRRKSLSLELNSHAPSKQFFVKKLFFKIHTPYFQGKFTKAVTSCTHSDAFKFAAKNSQPMQGQSANPDLFVSVSITARWPPVLIVCIQLLCLRRIRNRFNCLVESKPVKQEVSCRYSESSPLKSKHYSLFTLRKCMRDCFNLSIFLIPYSWTFVYHHHLQTGLETGEIHVFYSSMGHCS